MTQEEKKFGEEKPPFFNSWKGMYWLVMLTLATLILLFHLLTNYFS